MLRTHDRTQVGYPLDGRVQRALENVFCEGGRSTEAASVTAQVFLGDLRERESWLACDCQTADGLHPLMSPRQLEKNRVVLVRHGTVHHAETCPFFRLRAIKETSAVEKAVAAGDLLPELEVTPHDPDGFRQRYHAVLMRILHASDYGELAATDIRPGKETDPLRVGHGDVGSHYRQIDRAAVLPLAGSLTLGRGSCHHPNGLGRLAETLRWQNTEGLMLWVVDSVDRDTRLVTSTPRNGETASTTVRDMVQVHDGGGPYWMLGRVVPGEAGAAEVVAAYFHPIMSRSLLTPIDGEWERPLLGLLCQQLKYWWSNRGVDSTLEKPLVENGHGERPDFAIRLPDGRRIVVEILPHTDDDYRALRKRAIRGTEGHENVVDVIRFVVGRGDPESWRKRLTASVLRAMDQKS